MFALLESVFEALFKGILEAFLQPFLELVVYPILYVPGYLVVTVVTLGRYPEEFFGEDERQVCFIVGGGVWIALVVWLVFF
jgi:hypothetical protein